MSLFDKQLSTQLREHRDPGAVGTSGTPSFTEVRRAGSNAPRTHQFAVVTATDPDIDKIARGHNVKEAALLPELAAKVRKRLGQILRLGPAGILRTAYTLLLGRTVYRMADFTRRLAQRRQSVEIASSDSKASMKHLMERLERRNCGQGSSNSGVDGGPIATKGFGNDRRRLLQVLQGMLDLADAGCSVPRVTSVDWNSNTISFELGTGIPFSTYEEDNGISDDIVARIEEALLAVHRAGYVLEKTGKKDLLVTADGGVMLSGLQSLRPLAGLSRDASIVRRDADRKRFNELFGTALITAAALRSEALDAETGGDVGDRAYASIALRADIHWGRIWNTDVGTGRWNYILKDHLPIPQNGTVLDLGSNNGFNPLQMLRHGAASAVGVEYRESIIRDGEFLKGAFEWLDNRSYDFRYVHGSFADLPTFGLGRFDMVSALCALYYLSDAEMRQIARYIRTLTDVLVLQCNVDRLIYRANEEDYRRASVEFAVEVLEQAGFDNQQIVAPAGYSRPLVIGRAGGLPTQRG